MFRIYKLSKALDQEMWSAKIKQPTNKKLQLNGIKHLNCGNQIAWIEFASMILNFHKFQEHLNFNK